MKLHYISIQVVTKIGNYLSDRFGDISRELRSRHRQTDQIDTQQRIFVCLVDFGSGISLGHIFHKWTVFNKWICRNDLRYIMSQKIDLAVNVPPNNDKTSSEHSQYRCNNFRIVRCMPCLLRIDQSRPFPPNYQFGHKFTPILISSLCIAFQICCATCEKVTWKMSRRR